MKKHRILTCLTVCTVFFAVVIPLLNTTVLGSLYISFSSDVAIPVMLSETINYISLLIDVAAAYGLLSCLAYAVIAGQNRRTVILFALLSAPVVYAATMLVDLAFWSRSVLNVSYILSNLTNCVYELVRIAVVLIVCIRIAAGRHSAGLELFSMSGNLSRGLVGVTAVMTGFMLAANAAETVTLLITVGAPINISEKIYLIMPYVTTAIYTILGYLFMYVLLHAFSQKSPDAVQHAEISDSSGEAVE